MAKRKRSASTVTLNLEGLEVARGHDGLLRGEPEPTIVLCAYVIGDGDSEGGAECVLRHVERWQLQGAPPATALPKGEARLKHRLPKEAGDLLLLIAVALEEDSGGGVEEVFARLGMARGLSLFTVDEALPEPKAAHLAAASLAERGGVHEVHLLFGGSEAGTLAGGDEWIGAVAYACERAGKVRQLRLPFRAADGRNDWTLVLRLRA